MLINCTNHPYEIWNEPQCKAASVYGEVVDLPFPPIEPFWSPEQLRQLARETAQKIEGKDPEAVLVAGEFTFVFMLVDKLLADGVTVLSTCSKRITTGVKKPDGTNEKKSVFAFECFRKYERY